jgi:hypothetical protein
VTITHFRAVRLFSLFVSVVFGITHWSEPKTLILLCAFCFGLLVVGTIAACWLMWLVKH